MNTATPAHPANNFDFVRIVAATLVLYSHQYALSGQMEPSFFGLHSFGGFAVLIFFAISGYLVTQSWYSDPNILRFALRRLLRIWPALAVVVTLTALVLGPVVSSLPAADYYAHGGTWQYFLNLRFIAVYILPGVFEKNPYPLGVNGSIWTIPIEVLCYLVLAVCGLAGLLKKKTIWLAAIVIYLAWYLAQSSPDLHHSIHQKRELGAYFLSGSALYVLREYWQKRPWTWLAALALLAACCLQKCAIRRCLLSCPTLSSASALPVRHSSAGLDAMATFPTEFIFSLFRCSKRSSCTCTRNMDSGAP